MGALRKLADMFRPFMHRLQQASESFREGNVANAATEPPRLFEIGLGEPAHRTFLRRRSLFNLLRRADPEKQIGERKTGRILDSFFLRTGIAEVHLLHLPFEDLSQENRRVITFANVAQHLS